MLRKLPGDAAGDAASAPSLVPAAPGPRAASLRRRGTAVGLDSLLLLAVLWWALVAEVALQDEGAIGLFVGAWLVGCPLYFAVYHARGSGRTPGEREVGIALVDAGSGRPPGIARALFHAVAGVLSALLVLPLVLDVVLAFRRPDGRGWRDRLFRVAVVTVPAAAPAPLAWPATVADAAAFDRREAPGYLTAARGLPPEIRTRLKETTWRVYAGLVGLSTLLLPLLVADGEAELGALELVASWIVVAGIVLVSGVYWSQAAIVVALEAVRVGEGRLPLGELLRRAVRRVNGMTVAVVVLAALVAPAVLFPYLLPLAAFLVARFGLVVPALVLEDHTVHGAFLRSWRLTRGRTAQAVGLLVGTLLPVAALLAVSLAIFVPVALFVTVAVSMLAFVVLAGLMLLVFTLPASRLLATFGAAWCLFYYDRRSDTAPLPEG